MDHLRQGIHLRGYAQKNPKQEYKRESFELFTEMLENLKSDVVGVISKVQVQAPEDVEAVEAQRRRGESLPQNMSHATAENQLADSSAVDDAETFVRQGQKVGRNDPCPCGSGAKFKQCHGKLS
jgi:preprotein translocase subunit SecA